jgi:hypothetical protein
MWVITGAADDISSYNYFMFSPSDLEEAVYLKGE